MSFIQSLVWNDSTDNDFAGHISFIQELGAKARVIAVPTALLQWGFEPLHDWLDRFIHNLPQSCVHDQNKGAWFIQEQLNLGNKIWSFDLSSATDRFPLKLQTSLLRALHLKGYAEALEELVTEKWQVTSTEEPEAWKYEVGQPMGLYCSFPLFALTHLVLLLGLCDRAGISLLDAPFRVIGDDVIIASEILANEYSLALGQLGVEVSPAKTLQSSCVAEFAGFVGYRTNQSVAVFRPYKHSDTSDLHNPLGLIYALGSALRRTKRRFWADQVSLFQSTRSMRNPDLSPLLPSEGVEGLQPPTIDTTRLANLLSAAYAAANIGSNSYTGESLELEMPEDLANILLDKQDIYVALPGQKLPDELLATPKFDEVIPRTVGLNQKLSQDPLIRLEKSKRLYEQMTHAAEMRKQALVSDPEPVIKIFHSLDCSSVSSTSVFSNRDSASLEPLEVPKDTDLSEIRRKAKSLLGL
jgi:hypothetical protein